MHKPVGHTLRTSSPLKFCTSRGRFRVHSLTVPSDIQLVLVSQHRRCSETPKRVFFSQFWGANKYLHRQAAKHCQLTALQFAKPTSLRISANLEGDVPRQLLTRGLQAESLQQLVEVGEDTLTAAGEELDEVFPQLSFPAELLKGSPKAINDFLELPSAARNERIGLFVGSWIYLTARPGVLAAAVDAYVAQPFQTLNDFLRGRKFLKRKDFILGKRIGEGNFGTVFEGAIRRGANVEEQEFGRRSKNLEDIEGADKLKRVVMKKVKVGVSGAAESGEAEEWFNLRMRRVAPEACASYLGSFVSDASKGQFTEGGKWLVWKYEGRLTLKDYMSERDFPDNLGGIVFSESYLKGMDTQKRQALIIKQLLRQMIVSLKKMHSTGIVHRDVKPSNLIVTGRGEVKLIDFGAAADLRVGRNFAPDVALLDPDYCAPEQFVLPQKTPKPPPEPVAAFFSPILWQLNHPDLFDMYSIGIIFLQMASPSLRSPVGMQSLKLELKRAEYDVQEWRRATKGRPDLDILDADGGKGWDLVTKLVQPRGSVLKGRLSAAEALRHPYFLLGGDRAATLLSKFR